MSSAATHGRTRQRKQEPLPDCVKTLYGIRVKAEKLSITVKKLSTTDFDPYNTVIIWQRCFVDPVLIQSEQRQRAALQNNKAAEADEHERHHDMPVTAEQLGDGGLPRDEVARQEPDAEHHIEHGDDHQ